MIEKNKARIKEKEKIKNNIIEYKSNQIDLVNRTITILHELNIQVLNFYSRNKLTKKEFREDITKQAVQTLFKKSVSQSETILVLIENGKYLEAYSILRDLFENSILFLYITINPFEANRWFDWANMTFKKSEEYKQKYKRFDDFKLFLEENGHKELLTLVTPQNFKDYRDFSGWFIREQAFKNHPSINGADFKEFYYELCRFVHPSIKALNHNDILSETHFKDIVADTLYIAKNIAGIFIDFFKDNIDNSIIGYYETLKIEIKENEGLTPS